VSLHVHHTRKVYEQIVQRMRKGGWQVEYERTALGTRGSVYIHLVDTLKIFGCGESST
jgi:hypothetical protein